MDMVNINLKVTQSFELYTQLFYYLLCMFNIKLMLNVLYIIIHSLTQYTSLICYPLELKRHIKIEVLLSIWNSNIFRLYSNFSTKTYL